MPQTDDRIHAPELAGGQWLNGGPISMAALRGNPVLIDFWDYTCVNCIRTLPYLKEWHERYEPFGLRIIGVHAPEFTFAQQEKAVKEAIATFDLKYPVLLDNGYQIWKAFDNHYWAAKYLIDAQGYIRYYHHGERGYRETEEMIQQLIREVQAEAELPPLMDPVRDDEQPGAVCYTATPELYLGYSRGRVGNPHGLKPEEPSTYRDLGFHAEGYAYLEGSWVVSSELAAYYSMGRGPGKLSIQYTSKEVNLVMNPLQSAPAQVTLLQDGSPIDQRDWGEDVTGDGQGNTVVAVDGPRMYRLVRNWDFGSHELTLVTESHGLAMYAFTFVSCAAPPA